MTNHSKYYYQYDRNMSATSDINPKMKMTKEELGLVIDQYDGKTRTGGIMSDSRVPNYYKGKNGYEARKVCDNFDLSYHLATATTYILRAYHKHDTPVDCITKAIAHLQFELDKIKDEKANL
tara:strand:+ start:20 stop:385 length:366 start_codon:yes stop_codon:yes gene_type:complete